MSLLRRTRVRRLLVLAVGVVGVGGAVLVMGDREEAYVAGERSEGVVDTLARGLPEDVSRVKFEDATDEAGLVFSHFPATRENRLPEDMGSGVALGDVDADGWTDVYLVNTTGPLAGAATGWPDIDGRCRMFRNRRDATFEDVTEVSGTGLRLMGMGATFVDVDGDRDLDLFVSSYGRCHLLLNDGTGTFEPAAASAGVSDHEGFWTGLAVGDPDVDGDVDVYVCGYVRYDESLGEGAPSHRQYGLDIPALINPSTFEPERNLLLRNDGGGRFDEAADEAGVRNAEGRSLGASFADLDRDGFPDLYVANDVSDNALYHNRGDGTFVDRTSRAVVGDYRGAMGLAIADFDADLDLDLFITHWLAQENALYVNVFNDLAEQGQAPELIFVDEADQHGLGYVALMFVGWGTRFFDYDNDGWLDAFVVNGSTVPTADDRTRLKPMRTQLFWNAGPGRRYFDVGDVAGAFFGGESVGRGGATFDYDLDGDPDLVVVQHGERAVLLANDGGAGHVLTVRLRQPSGNTFALGAWIEIDAAGRTRLDHVGTQGSYLSQHAVGEVSFGLGEATRVDQVRVRWPDGTTDVAGPWPADRLVTWVRGEAPRVEVLPGRRAAAGRGPRDVDEQRRFYARLSAAADARLDRRFDDAIDAYGDALVLSPGHEEALYYLGNCLRDAGREGEALDVFTEMTQWHALSSRAWMQIGQIRLPGGDLALDDLAAARAAFERAHEINGEESGPIVRLGVVELIAGRLDLADAYFAAGARLNARSTESLYWRGYIAWRRGDVASAASLLAQAHGLAAASVRGDSASAEGETRTGAALVARAGDSSILDRWRTLASRPADPALEYADLDLGGVADGG